MKNRKSGTGSFNLAISEAVKDFAREMEGQPNKNDPPEKSIVRQDVLLQEKKLVSKGKTFPDNTGWQMAG